jgi:hypothetical protein
MHGPQAADRESAVLAMDEDAARQNHDELAALVRSDPSPAVRRAAVGAMAYVAKDRRCINVLAGVLTTEQDPQVLKRIVGGLAGFSREPAAVEALVGYWIAPPPAAVEAEVRGALMGLDPRRVAVALRAHPQADSPRAALLWEDLPGGRDGAGD